MDTDRELPEGWEWSSIGEACRVNVREPWLKALPDELQVSFVPMAAVDAWRGVISRPINRPLGEIRKGFTPFADGDVIFARITPSMENGKAAIADGLTNGLGFGSTEFHVMRPTDRVLPKWVFHFVRRVSFRNEAKASFTGTAGQLRVPDSFVRSAPIPLPPLPEQQRLVEKIESLLEQSRTAREALDRIPPLLKRFRQAVLAKAFRGELTERDPNDEPASVLLDRIREERRRKREEDLRAKGKDPRKAKYVEAAPPDTTALPKLPAGWVWTKWTTLSEWITYGFTRPMPHVEQGIPIVTAKNITDGQIDLTNTHKTTQRAFLELSGKDRPEAGDILLTKDGTIGRAAVVPPGVDFCINQSVAVVMLRVCPVPRSYLLHAIEAPFTQRAMADLAKGVALQHLSITDFGQLPLPLAPFPEQRRLVEKVQSALNYADQVQEAIDRATHRTDKVDQAVLARAFRGEV